MAEQQRSKDFERFRAEITPQTGANGTTVEFEISDKELSWKHSVPVWGTSDEVARELRSIATWVDGKKVVLLDMTTPYAPDGIPSPLHEGISNTALRLAQFLTNLHDGYAHAEEVAVIKLAKELQFALTDLDFNK